MSTGPISELVVSYDAGPLSEKLERRRHLIRSRIVSLAITIALLALIYVWQREAMQGVGFIIIFAVVLGISLAWLAASVILYVLAKREMKTIGSGIAIQIGPRGIHVAGLSAPWSQVAGVDTIKSGFDRGPRLRLTLTDGRQAHVPLDQITVFPATLDSTVRAFSAGRHGVDLSAIES
jgi:MFS family permease